MSEYDSMKQQKDRILQRVYLETERVLRDALNNKRGWRSDARRVLGLEKTVQCANHGCPRTFSSGGHRRLYCEKCGGKTTPR